MVQYLHCLWFCEPNRSGSLHIRGIGLDLVLEMTGMYQYLSGGGFVAVFLENVLFQATLQVLVAIE